jgi:hypothetical protein
MIIALPEIVWVHTTPADEGRTAPGVVMMRWSPQAQYGHTVGRCDYEAAPERQAVAAAPGLAFDAAVPAMTSPLWVHPFQPGLVARCQLFRSPTQFRKSLIFEEDL